MSITPTFLYHAQGCAFGGVMRRPYNEVLEAKAATALPQTGGVAFADEPGFNYKDLFRFDKASTRASGTRDGNGTHKTTITSTVEGLNITDVVKAACIVASLTTRHNGTEDEAHVDPSGSQFTGLTISGYPVAVDLDIPLMCQLDTLRGFKDKYAKDAGFRKMASDRFGWSGLNWPNPDTLPEPKGIVSCSLVKTISCGCPGLTINGNSIKVPNFGTIYLAEYWAKAGSRRLTMMRFALGSPTEGDVTVGGIDGNGTGFP
jgi:hypothetical protein